MHGGGYYGVENIVYISCKATSLARDLEMIQARGYRVVKCTAVDQFCQTVHVDSCGKYRALVPQVTR